MKLNGIATAGIKVPLGCFSLKTSVSASGVVIDSTILKYAFLFDAMPLGGLTTLSKLALISADVSGVPSWNFTPVRILKVNFVPPSVPSGTEPTHRSQTKSVGDAGLSGFSLINRL